MPASSAFAQHLAALILNASAIPNLADNAASAPIANVYLSLHTADPGAAGSAVTNEISYTGYARKAVARTAGSWTCVGGVGTLAADQSFPPSTGGTGGVASYWAISFASAGAAEIIARGPLTPSITINNGVTPTVSAGSTLTIS